MAHVGTTFSSVYARQLNLTLPDVVEKLLDFGFSTVRIGSYWNTNENTKYAYEYSDLDYIVSQCQRRGQNIILTVGVKSPRWPEFYIPSWCLPEKTAWPHIRLPFRSPFADLSDDILRYVAHTVNRYRTFDCITGWQVENEPLDPSGPDRWVIPLDLLDGEIAVVRSLDTRPVILNLWGNTLSARGLLKRLSPRADIIGIDLYYYVPNRRGDTYSGPNDSDESIQTQLQSYRKPVIITELQAEPWEHRETHGDTPSMNPEILEQLVHRVDEHITSREILLWGFEYWYHQKLHGDSRLWDTVERLMHS